jgi:hypothetical protein
MSQPSNSFVGQAIQAALTGKFEASKHPRGSGGKFSSTGGGAKKQGGSVAAAHALFDKMKGKPKADVLAAAQALGINTNTAKTQLYHWQKKNALAALHGNPSPSKADLQAAAAEALGVKKVPVSNPNPEPADNSHLAPGFHSGADGKLYFKLESSPHAHKVSTADGSLSGKATEKVTSSKHLGSPSMSETQALKKHAAAKEPTQPTPAPKPPVAAPKTAQSPAAEKPDLAKLGPTKYVHALADHMKGAEKKAVIAAATAAGVNKSTAGVQYGKWAAKQAGEKPQLAKSPEPKPLQAKQPQDMSDKELDKAIDSYQGKVDYQVPSASLAPATYKHADEYHDHQGGKALTSKLGNKEVYTNQQQGKTFFKDAEGNVHEHVGASGAMTKVAGDKPSLQYYYDPATKVVYGKVGGVLKPVQGVKTPLFKNQQPYDPGNHVFKDHAWAGANGIQDPDFKADSHFEQLKAVHAEAGVTYNETSPAVKSYTGSGYSSINGALRASKGESVGEKAKAIDALIAKSSFQTETIMWRGVGHGGTVFNGAPPPVELVDHGFTSVSFKPSTAKNFSDGKTLFRVKVPAGFPGLNVAIGSPGSGVAGLHGEAEVMLPRGTTYKVVARNKAAASGYGSFKMDVVDLEPVLPEWYVKKYGQPKLGA